jgi:hypothetical protein
MLSIYTQTTQDYFKYPILTNTFCSQVNGDRNPIDVFVDLRKVFEALDNNKSD